MGPVDKIVRAIVVLGIAVAVIFVIVRFTRADESYTIEPKYYDFNSRDGTMTPGTKSNPWVLKNREGKTIREVAPKSWDFNKRDNFNNPGSVENPWIIKVK